MSCYHAIPARREDVGPWTLNPQLGTADCWIPCGTCLGCRTDRQLDWTRRAVQEASLWRHNTFLTLTYDDEHLPRELIPAHFTKFIKRLRKKCSNDERILSARHASIRYLACGEYGEQTERPHYHACLFNAGAADQTAYSQDLCESPTFTTLWGNGAAKLAPFTAGTAGYVAGYLTKRGKETYADEWGEERQKPFLRSSLRPAIGREWLEKNSQDLQHGYMVLDHIKTRIPRYYIKKLLQGNAQARHEDIRARAQTETTDKKDENRIRAAEEIHKQHINKKRRSL